MIQNRTENWCTCKDCWWNKDEQCWFCRVSQGICRVAVTTYTIEKGFCPHCGCYLDDKGIAWRTVVIPEGPIEVWLAKSVHTPSCTAIFTEEPYRYDKRATQLDPPGPMYDGEQIITGEASDELLVPGEKRRYYLIPAPQEDEDE